MVPKESIFIGLGGNLGDRRAHLDAAVWALRSRPWVEGSEVSDYYETRPAGGPPGQGAFLNAVVRLDVPAGAGPSPHDIFRELQRIEAQEGRVRDVRWGERTLDLDLLMYGDRMSHKPDLFLPHPRMAVRRFVLAPMAEIAAETIDPNTGRTIANLLANLDRRPSAVSLSAWDQDKADVLFERLVRGLDAIGIRLPPDGFPGSEEGDPTAALRYVDRLDATIRPLTSKVAWAGGRWIVTDRYLDEDGFYLHRFPGQRGFSPRPLAPRELDREDRIPPDSPELAAACARFMAIRRTFPTPTFIACPKPPSPKSYANSQSSSRSEAWEHPTLSVVGLPVSTDDPIAAADEILATCLASRP